MRKLLFATLVVVFVLLIIVLPPGSLAALQHYQSQFSAWQQIYPLQTALAFFVLYVAIATLSIPGATLLTLLAGSQFGLLQGTLLVALAATCGATLAMLISRYLLRAWVQQRFPRQMSAINRGMEHEGLYYLFALRLTPVFPFFLINLLMGLTPVKTLHYFAVSLVGMLPAIVVYLNAGRELSKLRSPGDILSPGMMVMLILLGLLPLVSRRVAAYFATR
ncbi:TVP38/TMEM64 family protein [Buttiauxella warmboldiae]|uniref:TVP38/TMEM64 family membrane protein n=1 Tax=Buttiauxella warmboldiae TaxID=82993 RepID=A0A3N5DET4_9ENTR|nr:TVP38/TMEM64 family protein [Buttiauxella warmboldiae]RPH25947.1 TVP38/TMEM64 family protein [Buttiauxella warmboldiae]